MKEQLTYAIETLRCEYYRPAIAEYQWQTEWPEGVPGERNWWWLFARVWGDAEPTLYPVMVRAIADGRMAWISSGQFVYPSDVEGVAYWQPMTLPELPEQGESNGRA